jgi:hypothetical protein
MAYISPETVQSPKGRVCDIDVLYDKGPATGSWSIAKLKWDGADAIGIRWFIVPPEIVDAVISAAAALDRQKADTLLAGYREMAADEEREAEASAWSEALIGDGIEAR